MLAQLVAAMVICRCSEPAPDIDARVIADLSVRPVPLRLAFEKGPIQSQVVGDFVPGDFDGDGETDFIVASNSERSDGGQGLLSLDFIPANGGMERRTLIPCWGLAVADDFNRDGKVDVFVAGCPIYLGNGDGTFSAGGVDSPSFGYLAMGDLNADGRNDLVGSSDRDPGRVMLSNGDGTFRSVVALNLKGQFLLADWNGDHLADLLSEGPNLGALMLIGKGDGTFSALPEQRDLQLRIDETTGRGDRAIAADFNDDGKVDVMGLSGFSAGRGDGTLAAPVGVWPKCVERGAADFDLDGYVDVACELVDKVGPSFLIAHGNGDGTLADPIEFAAPGANVYSSHDTQDGWWSVEVNDLDHDGKPDVWGRVHDFEVELMVTYLNRSR